MKYRQISTKNLIKSISAKVNPNLGTRLWHFSRVGQIETLDPTHQGEGTPGKDLVREDTPVTWFYVEDTPTEKIVTYPAVCKYLYTLSPDNRIYDVHEDPENFWQKAIATRNGKGDATYKDPTALSYFFQEIKNAGFFGYRGSKGPLPGVIGIFYPVKIEKEIPKTDSYEWSQANERH